MMFLVFDLENSMCVLSCPFPLNSSVLIYPPPLGHALCSLCNGVMQLNNCERSAEGRKEWEEKKRVEKIAERTHGLMLLA